MNWFADSGKPLQSKVSRLMTEIFGSNAMEKYKSIFQGDIKKGFKKLLVDGSIEVEAVSDEDEDKDSNDDDLD